MVGSDQYLTKPFCDSLLKAVGTHEAELKSNDKNRPEVSDMAPSEY
jgi:hypothetical protein